MSHYIVKTASCTPSVKCWGRYARVAVLEVEDGISDVKMISNRAKGVVKIVYLWENCFVGSTERCAYRVALAEAKEIAKKLNNKELV
jgi:hypothetical protein